MKENRIALTGVNLHYSATAFRDRSLKSVLAGLVRLRGDRGQQCDIHALKDITIEATWCYPITIWPRIIGLVESGKLPIAKIIDGRIRAEDVVAKGFDVLTGAGNDKLKILVSTQL